MPASPSGSFSREKVTVPWGVVGVPVPVSVTVAVHVVGPATGTVAGVQLTFVEVGRTGATSSFKIV
ncbi:MAG: hypothetical protein M3Q17_03395, partial [Actinomycetota bacterium]|nr:hypothetical protein [Actinomycetota bacterium]